MTVQKLTNKYPETDNIDHDILFHEVESYNEEVDYYGHHRLYGSEESFVNYLIEIYG